MQEVIFIIGLPGSGKSTLIEHYKTHPFIDYRVYDDWMEILTNSKPRDFDADVRYDEFINDLNLKQNIIISCIDFCKNEFLYKSEYYIKSQSPEITITRVYFENNPEQSKLNIIHRDTQRGGYWEDDMYVGLIFDDKPLYKEEIKKSYELSSTYNTPDNYFIFPIIVQKD